MSRATGHGRSLGFALMQRFLARQSAHDTSPAPPTRVMTVATAPSRPATAGTPTRPTDRLSSASSAPPEEPTWIRDVPPAHLSSAHDDEHGDYDEEPIIFAAPLIARPTAETRLTAYMDRFCHVTSDYARQWTGVDRATGEVTHGWARTGKKQPDDCALTPRVVERHLKGEITAGTYLLDERNRCKLLVLDHDDKRTLGELDTTTDKRAVVDEDGLAMLQDCRARLEAQGIACAVSESRRGGHLFVFLDEAVDARDARALAMLALGPDEVERMARGEEAFEIYPKQNARGSRDGSVGSNIALPLGVHLKDGERHPFVDHNGDTVARTLSGQLDHIEGIARAPVREVLDERPWLYHELDKAMHPIRPRAMERDGERTHDVSPERARPRQGHDHAHAAVRQQYQGESMIARWKAGVDTRDIVQAYGVKLDANGIGKCPLHDDGVASFQAWDAGWVCYAEHRGGDALGFIQAVEGITPKEALAVARDRFPVLGIEGTTVHR